ncbi:Bax inhibitor-1/YccA family protein [Actinotalea sp. K2]|uniref:Bax inhibitor-1/YccA family protein n=1 Tax=Actinotalea sp. K2 TaxID=2939438 RepID=UPI002016DD1D|nr:Bax inhibitor-1/YccA family protein [Actinotalea sp. K2]MCL3861315.1 Bax inhibitor-1/YccA family protein [Actinotalea sp. K2]
MSNPVFSNSAVFGQPRQGRAGVQQRAPYAGSAATPAAGTLEQMYGAPTATPRDTGRLTYDDVIMKTAGLFAILLVTGGLTWVLAPELFFVGMIVGLGLGLVNAFKKQPSPPLIMAYAAAQGVFLGGLTHLFEGMWPGIAMQAVLATVATFAACLVLFRSGKVRVTPKFQRWLMISVGGYLVFSLVNLVLVWTGTMGGWGLREGPFGIIIGLVAVGLASAVLIMDFDSIKRGVEQGAPAKMAWSAAFGLMVTLVWLYVEFLRIFAILRGD